MVEKTYLFYENGKEEELTTTELNEFFDTEFDNEQKLNGTTFDSWIREMIEMQILVEIDGGL